MQGEKHETLFVGTYPSQHSCCAVWLALCPLLLGDETMNGKPMLYLDQWGTKFWANTVRGLRKQIGMGGSKVSKMYVDKKDGRTVHTGYVVGQHWLTAYTQTERKA